MRASTRRGSPLQLHFQEKPWDLFVSIGYTASVGLVLLASGVGSLLGILLVVFTPGYVLVAACFPKAREMDWIERIVLSFGLSVGVVPLLGLLLNLTPWGIRLVPVVVSIIVFTFSLGWAAYWRRMRLPVDQRLSLTFSLAIPTFHRLSLLDRGLTIGLAVGVVVTGGALAFVVLTANSGDTYTEFYVLTAAGNASGYPTTMNVSQEATVILGVVNHESVTVSYLIRIELVGVKTIHNVTSGLNETIAVNRTTWSTLNFTLASEQNLTWPYTFRINSPGLWELLFLLFMDRDLSSVYRQVHLYVRVE